jgi:hypothetical protein
VDGSVNEFAKVRTLRCDVVLELEEAARGVSKTVSLTRYAVAKYVRDQALSQVLIPRPVDVAKAEDKSSRPMEYCGYRPHVPICRGSVARPSATRAKLVMAKGWSRKRSSWRSRFLQGSMMACEFDCLVKDSRVLMEVQREMLIVSSD